MTAQTFTARGRTVVANPVETKTEDGKLISVGFPVCTLTDFAEDKAATLIATALTSFGPMVEALRDVVKERAHPMRVGGTPAPADQQPAYVRKCMAALALAETNS